MAWYNLTMRPIHPTTGEKDIDGRVITSGASVIVCSGYAHKSRRYDCLLRVKAKHVVAGPFQVEVTYTGKPLKSQEQPKYVKPYKNRTRNLKRAYRVTNVQINVGKIGLVLGRNRFIASNWDVVLDGIVYAMSAKYLKVLETDEDVANVQAKIENKPEILREPQ